MDFVPREEFEAVKAMAAKARSENESPGRARLPELEKRLAAPSSHRRRARANRSESCGFRESSKGDYRRTLVSPQNLVSVRITGASFCVRTPSRRSSECPSPNSTRLLSAPHPLDMLEQAVEDNGWAFERSGRDELNLSVAGRWCDHHFCFTWRDELQSLHLSSAFDMRVRRQAAARDRQPADVCERASCGSAISICGRMTAAWCSAMR